MSNSDFNRGLNILQGLLDTAMMEAAQEKTPEPTPAVPTEPVPEPVPEPEPVSEPVVEPEPVVESEPVVETEPENQPPSGVSRRTAALLAACSAGLGIVFTLLLTPAATPVPAATDHSGCIRADLVLEPGDLSAWNTAARMHGRIDGVDLQFDSGIAEAGGLTYKVALDFCVNGETTFVKVACGDKAWVACVDKTGTIAKTYPAPRNGKSLKALFGPRPKK